MQDIRHKLTILHTTDGVAFTDISVDAFDFLRDELTCTGTLYIGYRKPIHAFYVHLAADAENAGTFTYKYYNGSFVTVSPHDNTKNFTRSGFVQWEKDEEEVDDEVETTINDIEQYWYKVEFTADDPEAAEYQFMGIGIVFCDEYDLKDKFYYVDTTRYYPEGETSHIRSLISARNEIMKSFSDRTPWDMLHVAELKDCAVSLALHYICKNASTEADDKDYQRAEDFYDEYVKFKTLVDVSVDLDDDGVESEAEKRAHTSVTHWSR